MSTSYATALRSDSTALLLHSGTIHGPASLRYRAPKAWSWPTSERPAWYRSYEDQTQHSTNDHDSSSYRHYENSTEHGWGYYHSAQYCHHIDETQHAVIVAAKHLTGHEA